MEETEKIENTYLTFRLGDEHFAAGIEKALSILEYTAVTKVPRSPEYMKGVINQRGNVLPVIDTRMKFGMPPSEITKRSVIVVFRVEIDNETADVGALIDEPGTVVEVLEENITSAPSIGAKYKSELIKGMLKLDDKFVMILNIDKVFSLDELIEIQENTNQAAETAK